MNCSPQALALAARCWCLPLDRLRAAQSYLLCQWANEAGEVCQSSFVTFPTTATRNDFTIAVGFQFQVLSTISVTKMGRLYVSGNVQDHVANLWLGPGPGTLLASGTILASSTSDANNFKWVDITPVTLSPGNTYVIGLDEYSSGDKWKDTWATAGFVDATYFTSVVEKFTLGSSVFPATGVATDHMYSTPAMCFFPVETHEPETVVYKNAIAANGGTISDAALDCVDDFVLACKSANIWTKLWDVGVFLGNQLAAGLVKLKDHTGTTPVLINGNFVAGDYSEAGGLVGDGLTKYLDTAVVTDTVNSLTLYITSRGTTNFCAMIGERVVAGGDHLELWANLGFSRGNWGPAATQRVPPGGSTGLAGGLFSTTFTPANTLKLYQNGLQLASVVGTGARMNNGQSAFLFANNGLGLPVDFSDGTILFYALGDTLSAVESLSLYFAVQQLQNCMSRGTGPPPEPPPGCSTIIIDDGTSNFWKLVVDNLGNVGAEPAAGPATSPDPILMDSTGAFWQVKVDTNGLRYADSTLNVTTGAPVLCDGVGGFWQLVVDDLGNIGAESV